MPVRDRGARERFLRQASFTGAVPGASLFHHPPRRSSVQDAAAQRHRRRSTLRRQVARELIAEEEESLPVDPKPPPLTPTAPVACDRRRGSASQQEFAPISNPPDVSRLRTRRQSTPVALPLRDDPEFSKSPVSRPIRPTPRRSISTDEAESSGSTTVFKYLFIYLFIIEIVLEVHTVQEKKIKR